MSSYDDWKESEPDWDHVDRWDRDDIWPIEPNDPPNDETDRRGWPRLTDWLAGGALALLMLAWLLWGF